MLTLYEGTTVTMQIEGRWLYPLFVLYLAQKQRGAPLFPAKRGVAVRDPRIGRGAVFLYQAIGIRKADGEICSDLAMATADALGIRLSPVTRVPSLACATEDLLQNVSTMNDALPILEGRLSEVFLADPGQYVAIAFPSESAATRSVREFLDASSASASASVSASAVQPKRPVKPAAGESDDP